MRDRTIIQENWNWFVNEEDNKTDFFLRFLKPHTKNQYGKYLFATQAYSLRFQMMMFQMLHFYTLDVPENVKSLPMFYIYQRSNILLAISLFATTQMFHQAYRSMFVNKYISDYYFTLLLVSILPAVLINKTASSYFAYTDQLNMNRDLLSSLSVNESSPTDQLVINSLMNSNTSIKTLRWFILILHNTPLFFMGSLIICDWLEYGFISIVINIAFAFLPIYND